MNKIVLFTIIEIALTFCAVHAQSSWIEKVYFDSIGRRGAVGFALNGKGYLSTGSNLTGSKKDLWEYNPDDETWTQKADMSGEERQNAVAFAIGNYGYIGTGEGLDYLKDFRQYDPMLNQWTSKAKLPGEKRAYATGFSIGDKGYIGSGFGPGGRKDYYEYDPATDTWTQIADLPGAARSGAAGFSIGGKGYVAFGSKSSSGESNDLWEYDPATGQWTQKTSCPGLPRDLAVAFVINNKAYVGTGLGETEALNDLWQYDPLMDTWTEMDSLPGSRRYEAVGFAIGNSGYVGIGELFPNYVDDFWEFTPGCVPPTNLLTTNISTQSAKLKWDAVTGATKYKVQYKKDSIGAPWLSKTINATKTAVTISNLTTGSAYKWKVRSICGDEQSEYSLPAFFTTSQKLSNELDEEFPFKVNPNPLTGNATISFSLKEDGHTLIEAFDLTGRRTVLMDEQLDADEYEIAINKEQLGEGVYLVKLITGNIKSVIKVVVH